MKESPKLFSLGILIAVILAFCFGSSGLAQDDSKAYDPWAWTRKNLDTGWMKWDRDYWPSEPVRGGYFRRAAPLYIGLMNPNHWPVNDWTAIGYFYEGITAYNGEYRQDITWLMESFEFLDPVTLIMKVKQGVKFHDGADFNAKSVKSVFDYIGDKKNGCWTRGQQRRIKSLEVLDEYTLRWRTHEPWGSFPQGFFSFMISPKALQNDMDLREAKKLPGRLRRARTNLVKTEKKAQEARVEGGGLAERTAADLKKAREEVARLEEIISESADKLKEAKDLDKHPVGTGPFVFEDASPGNYLTVKRNPDWWFGQSIGRPEMPYFDGIKTYVIPDPAIQLANLRAGKIDAMGVSKAQYQMIKDDPSFYVYDFPSNTVISLIFNQAGGPCRDIRVRQAISHAIDRKALIAGTQFGMARIASCYWPGDHWAHNPNLEPVAHDPELSKRLLKEAGYEKGLTVTGITYNLTETTTLAAAVKNMLAGVGITWQVDALDPAAIDDRMRNLEFDMNVGGDIYMQDPDASVKNHYDPKGRWNNGRNNNEKVIALAQAGRIEIDRVKRQEIYHQIEEELYRNYEDAWLFWGVGVMAYRKNVQGWNNELWKKYRTWYSMSHPLWFKDGGPDQ